MSSRNLDFDIILYIDRVLDVNARKKFICSGFQRHNERKKTRLSIIVDEIQDKHQSCNCFVFYNRVPYKCWSALFLKNTKEEVVAFAILIEHHQQLPSSLGTRLINRPNHPQFYSTVANQNYQKHLINEIKSIVNRFNLQKCTYTLLTAFQQTAWTLEIYEKNSGKKIIVLPESLLFKPEIDLFMINTTPKRPLFVVCNEYWRPPFYNTQGLTTIHFPKTPEANYQAPPQEDQYKTLNNTFEDAVEVHRILNDYYFNDENVYSFCDHFVSIGTRKICPIEDFRYRDPSCHPPTEKEQSIILNQTQSSLFLAHFEAQN